MYFLFSGEGATDLGVCANGAATCEGASYNHGPMTVIVKQIVERRLNYSILDAEHYGFVSKSALVDRASELKAAKKALGLPGKKRPKETRYFFNNARVLARIAGEKQNECQEDVVAVLFRDSDETASSGRGLWKDKRQSMIDGFKEERFATGVPMMPKPKSEAWLLCALKENPYQACANLEDRSGKGMKNELKKRLAGLGYAASREDLREIVSNRTVDIDRIDMPSFGKFRRCLEKVI